MIETTEEVPLEDRVFDWKPRFDDESKNYAIRTVVRSTWHLRRRNKLWTIADSLDQWREGTCVGHAWVHEALSTPVRVNLARVKADAPRDPSAFARFIYKEAQKIDEWAGEAYEGTSVLAGAKVMKRIGLLREYRWSFSVDDLTDAVLAKGTNVLGTYWYTGMANTNPAGFLSPTGRIAGGHAYLDVGYAVKPAGLIFNEDKKKYEILPGGTEDAHIIQNSWGLDWGVRGLALITVSDLAKLLDQDGEACVPYLRSFGR